MQAIAFSSHLLNLVLIHLPLILRATEFKEERKFAVDYSVGSLLYRSLKKESSYCSL